MLLTPVRHEGCRARPALERRVIEDLHAVVKALHHEGCDVLEKMDDSENGKFARVIDPEGTKVERWQPPAGE